MHDGESKIWDHSMTGGSRWKAAVLYDNETHAHSTRWHNSTCSKTSGQSNLTTEGGIYLNLCDDARGDLHEIW